MTVSLQVLCNELDELLRPDEYKDYCPNGLQVEGRAQITSLVSGVTASQALIDAAIARQADAILVHHGYFWRGEDPCLVGMKRRRIQSLLEHQISLLAYHLPLDAHAELGNNAQLAQILDFSIEQTLGHPGEPALVMAGRPAAALSATDLARHLESRLARPPLHIPGSAEMIQRLAWCTGAAQSYIEVAVEAGVDAFITGEISEQTVHIARETGVHFFSAGHHATERYGVQAVAEYLAAKFPIDHCFIDIDNPV